MLGLVLLVLLLGVLFTGLVVSAQRRQNALLGRAEEQVAVLTRRADRLAARRDAPVALKASGDGEPAIRPAAPAPTPRPSVRPSPAYLPTDPEFVAS